MKRCKQLLITLCILAMLLPQMLVTGIFQAEAATSYTSVRFSYSI